MRIEHLTHPNYDVALATEIADIERAAYEVDAPHLEPRTVNGWFGALMYGWDLQGAPHVLVARDDAAAMRGYVRLDLPLLDNTSLMGIDMTTDPSIQDQAVDDALYDEVVALAREIKRPQLVCATWRDTRRAAF